MTEKRFELTKSKIDNFKIDENHRIYDYENEDAYFISCNDEKTLKDIVDLLNALHEENQSYKQKVENTLLEFYKLYEGQIFWEIADELEFDLEKALKEDLE